jgi:phage virion morphogenesis protein
MAGIEIIIDAPDLAAINSQLLAMGDIVPDLLPSLAVMIEGQTRRRISDDKAGPDGKRWPAWSTEYAKTRRGGQSLLMSSGGMLDSLAGEVTGADEVTVGSDAIQAALMQFGGTDDMPAAPAAVPARPFLGVSDDDLSEISDLISLAVQEHLQ